MPNPPATDADQSRSIEKHRCHRVVISLSQFVKSRASVQENVDKPTQSNRKRGKFENRLAGPTILPNEFSQIMSRVARRVPQRYGLSQNTSRNRSIHPTASRPLGSHSEKQKINFARDLQDRLGILALLALSAPFRICKLQILLATRETDPVSGHHLKSTSYKM